MEIIKLSINGSPFLGVFCIATDEIALVPVNLREKEEKKLGEAMGVEVFKAGIDNSSLLGVFAVALGKKIAVPELIEAHEKAFLEKRGLKVKVMKGMGALGNLVAVNENAGIASPLLSEKEVKELAEFFSVPFSQARLAGMDLPGAMMKVTSKGFIACPKISEKEFGFLRKTFKVHGTVTTANFGDVFVGNSVIANANAAVVGMQTSGHELLRIDEGLRGEEN
ncbi:MAG: translation initiation factor IF-6 [Candidatus Diapherotrites archaeon]